MNETISTIMSRRSVRKYKDSPIENEKLQQIMDAAIFAPNALNTQSWHFSVIRNKSIIKRMVEIIKENVLKSDLDFLKARCSSPDYSTFYHAPVVILITGDEKQRFVQIDCGATLQTIALTAESLGISSCPITTSSFLFVSKEGNEMKKQLKIPDGYNFMCSVALGYIDGDKPQVPPRKKEVIDYID